MTATWNLTRAALQQLGSPVTKQVLRQFFMESSKFKKSLLFLAICMASVQNAAMADGTNGTVYVVPEQGEKELSTTFMMLIVVISILSLVFFGGCIAGVAILINRSKGDSSDSSPEVVVVN